MATYSSFKKVTGNAILDGALVAADIAPDTIPTAAIQDGQVPSSAISGTVTSAKIASTVDLSAKTVTYRTMTDGDFSASAGITSAKLAGSAITTNLGFTPVNAGGDTMTGNLTVPAGSVSAPSIRQASSSNTGIYFPSTSQMAFTVGGTNRLNIGAGGGGEVQMGNRPSFCVAGTTGWYYANTFGGGEQEIQGNVWGWAFGYETGGSNFNTTYGRFTAPVSGYYHFDTMWYLLNDANTAPHYVHLFFRKNNSRGWTPGGRSPYTINMHSTSSSYDDGASYAAIMQLNAGDYCSLAVVWHGYSSRMHSAHQFFNGYLIG
jgi:hypothetical protein